MLGLTCVSSEVRKMTPPRSHGQPGAQSTGTGPDMQHWHLLHPVSKSLISKWWEKMHVGQAGPWKASTDSSRHEGKSGNARPEEDSTIPPDASSLERGLDATAQKQQSAGAATHN